MKRNDSSIILVGLAYVGLCGVIWAGFTLWNRVDTALTQIDQLNTRSTVPTSLRPAKEG